MGQCHLEGQDTDIYVVSEKLGNFFTLNGLQTKYETGHANEAINKYKDGMKILECQIFFVDFQTTSNYEVKTRKKYTSMGLMINNYNRYL